MVGDSLERGSNRLEGNHRENGHRDGPADGQALTDGDTEGRGHRDEDGRDPKPHHAPQEGSTEHIIGADAFWTYDPEADADPQCGCRDDGTELSDVSGVEQELGCKREDRGDEGKEEPADLLARRLVRAAVTTDEQHEAEHDGDVGHVEHRSDDGRIQRCAGNAQRVGDRSVLDEVGPRHGRRRQ